MTLDMISRGTSLRLAKVAVCRLRPRVFSRDTGLFAWPIDSRFRCTAAGLENPVLLLQVCLTFAAIPRLCFAPIEEDAAVETRRSPASGCVL